MKEEKIILADDPQAAQEVTMTLFKSIDGSLHVEKERAIYASITHKKCECGKIMDKYQYKCDSCRVKDRFLKYLEKPHEPYEDQVVCLWDDDTYFFTEGDIVDYMIDHELTNIDLMICEPQPFYDLETSYWEDILPMDHDDPKELTKAVEDFNKVIRTFGPASWHPGKIRTSYNLEEEESCN